MICEMFCQETACQSRPFEGQLSLLNNLEYIEFSAFTRCRTQYGSDCVNDNELHIVNLSSIYNIEPEEMIDKWKFGLKLALQKRHSDFADICVYETVTRLFETLYIHTMKFDNKGRTIEDIATPIQPN